MRLIYLREQLILVSNNPGSKLFREGMSLMVNYWGMVVTKGESWGGILLLGQGLPEDAKKELNFSINRR